MDQFQFVRNVVLLSKCPGKLSKFEIFNVNLVWGYRMILKNFTEPQKCKFEISEIFLLKIAYFQIQYLANSPAIRPSCCVYSEAWSRKCIYCQKGGISIIFERKYLNKTMRGKYRIEDCTPASQQSEIRNQRNLCILFNIDGQQFWRRINVNSHWITELNYYPYFVSFRLNYSQTCNGRNPTLHTEL